MAGLKLQAMDEADLQVISAHLQDAVLRIEDIAYRPRQKRFAAIANRFDWQRALTVPDGEGERYERRRSALRIERVLGAQVRNMPLDKPNLVLALLAIHFEAGVAPGGHVTLVFAGGGSIRLAVECIEAELRDLGPVWRTKSKPRHEIVSGREPVAAGVADEMAEDAEMPGEPRPGGGEGQR
ncbi:MAG: DUF2948 family protein [Rhizobiales bacterium]|nr:DUF2948 family protein [Hyphomicrobiales bacterium]